MCANGQFAVSRERREAYLAESVALKTNARSVDTTAQQQARHASYCLRGLRRVWIAIPFVILSLVAAPAAAQDCGIGSDDWDNIQLFRRCVQEHGLDAWTPRVLHQAAAVTGNPTIVQLLLEAGADPNARDDRGLTPLHEGATNSNPVVAAHLLAAGADPNGLDNDGYTPLHYAAARSGNGRVVTRLLGAGADPLVESNDGRTPLHSALRYAAERGVISELVEAGAAENLTPLQLAALQGNSATVASLLAEGADPNALDGYGWSSVHFAVPLAGSGVVSALLEAGADPNARTVGGATALHLAAPQATIAVVSNLLRGGTDPNAADGQGEWARTPLHSAALSSDDPSVVLALLNAGADKSVRDARGQHPVDFARTNDAMTGSDAYRRLLVHQPSALLAGRSATGDLESTDGVRWGLQYYDEWTYSAVAGQRIVITMESEEVFSLLLVLRDDGTEVATETTYSGYNISVEFQATTAGQYTILATSDGSEQTGRYTIRLQRPTGGEDTGAHAGSSTASEPRTPMAQETLVFNRTFSGSLSSSDAVWDDDSYYDRWTFSARTGQRLFVTMESDDVVAISGSVGRGGITLESRR